MAVSVFNLVPSCVALYLPTTAVQLFHFEHEANEYINYGNDLYSDKFPFYKTLCFW